MDIAREGQKLLLREHGDGFFARGGRRLAQVQLGRDGDHKDIMPAGFADGDERFEAMRRVLPERGGDLRAAERAAVIGMDGVGGLFAVELAHGIGFFVFFVHGNASCGNSENPVI